MHSDSKWSHWIFHAGQISDEKNHVAAASISSHLCKSWISLLLECFDSITGFILCCFQHRECNRAEDTGG